VPDAAGINPVTRHISAPTDVVFSPSGRLATWSVGESALFWNLNEALPVARSESAVPEGVISGHLSPDGARFYLLASDESAMTLVAFDAETGAELGRYSVLEAPIGMADLLSTGVTTEGRFMVRTESGQYTFSPDDAEVAWRAELTDVVPESSIPAFESPDGRRVATWQDGIAIEGPAGESYSPNVGFTRMADHRPTWSSDSQTLVAEVEGRLYLWRPALRTYSAFGPMTVTPIEGTVRAAIRGSDPDTYHFLWENGPITTWTGSQRTVSNWPDDVIPDGLLAPDGSSVWLIHDGCSISALPAGGPEQSSSMNLCIDQPITQLAWLLSSEEETVHGISVRYPDATLTWNVRGQVTVEVGTTPGPEVPETPGPLQAADPAEIYRAVVPEYGGPVHIVDALGTTHLSLFRLGTEDWVVYTAQGRSVSSAGAAERLKIWVDHRAATAEEAGWLEDRERVDWTALGLVFDD
jgi:hypothetical protein